MDELKSSNKSLASSNTPSVTASAMANATKGGSVETFSLVHPADTNDYCGVYLYLDEVGMLKGLPLNARATRFAVRCGFDPPPNFHGKLCFMVFFVVVCFDLMFYDSPPDFHSNAFTFCFK
jgi:hypothetical protein